MALLATCLAVGALASIQSPVTWYVLGTFDNPNCPPTASGATRKGFDQDFLLPLGGESKAVIGIETRVGEAKTVKAEVLPGSPVDFVALFTPSDSRVAYAYTEVSSEAEETRTALFGSDDAAKVWVNGELAHSMWTSGRALTPDEDVFPVKLRKGVNRILVKVDNGAGGWGFTFRLPDAEEMRAIERARERRGIPFLRVEAASESGAILGDAFPELRWREPKRAEGWVRDLKVRWFDPELAEVAKPGKPGLYLAHAEAVSEGMPYRRILPFFKPSGPWLDQVQFPPFSDQPWPQAMPPLPNGMPVDPQVWKGLEPVLSEGVWSAFAYGLRNTHEGALLLAYATLPRGKAPKIGFEENPDAYFVERSLALRRKLEGRSGDPLAKPLTLSRPAPTLRRGNAEEAGLPSDLASKLDKLCREWSRKEGVPFSALVARNGVVFFEGAYGKWDGKPTRKDQPFYPASIGKAMAGAVMTQFYDQGIVSPDDLVSKVLRGYPADATITPTFRGCFAHLSGLDGHFTYRGLWNPYLDHDFLVGQIGARKVGEVFRYGGDGNNLAGMAMELLTGRPMVRLLKDQLFDPLGMKDTSQFDLGFADQSTCWDTAIFGQMLLNGGAYGKVRLFSEKTALATRPVPISPYFPNLTDKSLWWGAGLSHMFDVVEGPESREKNELGPNVFGHGSASSSIFRVNPDHGYVIVMGRQRVGDGVAHGRYRGLFMRMLKEAAEKN